MLSKSRKKNRPLKLPTSTCKQARPSHKQSKQTKQMKQLLKHNHHSSTLTLLTNHNASYVSQTSLLPQSKTLIQKKNKPIKNRDTSIPMKDQSIKQKQKNPHLKQHKKNKKIPTPPLPIKPKKNIIKLSSQCHQKIKQIPFKQYKLSHKQQLYQKINITLFKSKTNSQINFSSSSSIRQNYPNHLNHLNQSHHKKILTIDCSDQYILNQYFNNSRIKNYQKKKIQAAIKIQKIFRGYMTRKILKNYTEDVQLTYLQLSKNKISQQPSKIKQYHTFYQGQSNQPINQFNQKIIPQSNLKPSPSHPQNQQQHKLLTYQPIDFQMSLKNCQKQHLQPLDHGPLQQQSSIIGQQQSLSRYLPFQDKYAILNTNQYQDPKNSQKQQKKQKSFDYFKLTPNLSSQQSKSKGEQPIPTDFSQQRVQQFQYDIPIKSKQLPSINYTKKSKISLQYPSNSTQNFNIYSITNTLDFLKNQKQSTKDPQTTSLPKKQKYFKTASQQQKQHNNHHQPNNQKKQNILIKLLKKQQKQKWNTIIQMLNQQIKFNKSKNQDQQKFINIILEFSKKNKQDLQQSTSSFDHHPHQFQKITPYPKNKPLDFILFNKPKPPNSPSNSIQDGQNPDLNLTKQLIKAQKSARNQNMPLLRKKIHNINNNNQNKQNLCYSLLEKTQQLKNFYRKNYSDYPIQQMIQIRQKALQKRQKQLLTKLNQDLYTTRLTHQQFILHLSQLQQKFEYQRQLITKAKTQIFIGYRATHKLMQDTFKDAWYLGYKIPFSQSLKDIKQNYNRHQLWVRQLIVDQLKNFGHGHALNFTGTIKISPNTKIIQSHLNQNSRQNITNSNQTNPKKPPIPQQNTHEPSQPNQQPFPRKDKQSDRKRQDLSIILPNQDPNINSKTQSKSNQFSQHSLYSQQISYNEGQLQIQNLSSQAKHSYISDQQLNQSSSQQSNKKQPTHQKLRKLDPQSFIKRPLLTQNQIQGPLLLDPDEQQYIDNIVMRKISINQKKRQSSDPPTPSQSLKKNQLTPRNNKNNYHTQPKSQVYKVDFGSEQSEDQEIHFINTEQKIPQIKQITELQISKLIWQITSQIYTNIHMRSKFCRNKSKLPSKISFQQRLIYLKCLQQKIPTFNSVQCRLNQKMTASRMQLLKFLRVSFEDEQQPQQINENLDQTSTNDQQVKFLQNSNDGFQEIGKFQHVISSDICTDAINNYLQLTNPSTPLKILPDPTEPQQKNQQSLFTKLKQQLKPNLSTQCIKKVIQRQKFHLYNQVQKNDLKKQIIKIQFHCIFDALNQLLIKKRLKFNGYSGIGLNQLTTIMRNEHTKPIKQQRQYNQLIEDSIKQLNQLLSPQKTSGQKLLLQNYQRLCQNDSQWIYYTQEALSFALEFVYMLEDQIIFEETASLFKIFNKF